MAKVIVTGQSGFVGQHLVPSPDVSALYNLASISSVELSISEPDYVISNNIECMLDALDQAKKSRRLFIHLSTVEAARPSNPYAASKAAQEAIALSYYNTYGLPVIIARSHNIVGEGQSGDKFIPTLIKKIQAGKTIQIYGNGSRVYNPVENVVDALTHLAEFGKPGRTYLITGGERVTNLNMAKRVAKLLGKPLKYKLVPGRPGYQRALRGEGEKIPGWTPSLTLTQGMEWITSLRS